MSTFTNTLLFIIMLGMTFCLQDTTYAEKEINKLVGSNRFDLLIRFIGIGIGFITCLTAAIYFSITEKWWYFLLFIPSLALSALVKAILCKIIPFNKIGHSHNNSYAQAVVKREFGALLIILSYVIYFKFR